MTRVSVPAVTAMAPGGRLRSRASWTLLDQVISSGTNAGLSVVVARAVGATEFGAFSIAFLVFSFSVGLCRALVTEPLIVRFSSGDAPTLRAAGRRAAGASLVIGLLGSLLSASVGGVVGGDLGAALLALALVLPGLLVQEAWRQLFFALGRPRSAVANDGVWALAQVALVGGILATGHGTVFALTVAWGGAALVAAAVGAVQAGGAPRPSSAWPWLRAHRDLSGQLAASYTINMGAVHITMALVGAIGGLAAVGAVRAAQVLLGPLPVLFPGLTAFALPLLTRRAAQDRRSLLRPALLVSTAAAGAAVAWVVLLLLLPDAWGRALLGDSWEQARAVLPAVGAMTALIGATMGGALSLKALSLGRRVLQMMLVQSPLILVLGCLGAWFNAGEGAATGLALAHVSGCALAWTYLWRAVRPGRRP